MHSTERHSRIRVRIDESRMSLYAIYQQARALTAKSATGGTAPLNPTAARNWAAKTAKPARPATPMRRYDQMSVHPENTPVAAPNPRPV